MNMRLAKKLAKSRLGRKYSFRPIPQHRRTVPRHLVGLMPTITPVDFRPDLMPVRDQGEEDCFGFAGGSLAEHFHKLKEYLSVAYLDWRVRLAECSFGQNVGADIADVLAVLNSWGCPLESMLPYKGDPTEAGNPALDVAAAAYRLPPPAAVDCSDVHGVQQVLCAGKTIELALECYESYEDTGPDGIVPPPAGGLLGGHANLLCGWRLNAQGQVEVISRNSWGESFGDHGYCYFPAAVLQQVAFEGQTTQ